MAESVAKIGFGAYLLKEDTPGSGTYTDFGVEVVAITPPGMSRDAIDVTHSASPDEFKEYIAGVMDGGEVALEINYIPSASDVVFAAFLAGKQNWQISLPGSVTWTFAGVVTAYTPTTPLLEKMSLTATFKVSGKPVLA